MASHFLSVCVFCFLCATHSPCESHVGVNKEVLVNGSVMLAREPLKTNADKGPDLIKKKSRIVTPFQSTPNIAESNLEQSKSIRQKRHMESKNNSNKVLANLSDQNISNLSITENRTTTKIPSKQYLRKIFEKYGNGESMNLDGFERMMEYLSAQLPALSEEAYEKVTHKTDKSTDNSTENQCLIFQEELNSSDIKIDSNVSRINEERLVNLCPVILYKMLFGTCSTTDSEQIFIDDSSSSEKDYLKVWLYSNIAVVIVSVCGVVGLAVIPIMQKRYYQPLLQFLVALAVGTLAGDALLHLLPHAMSTGGDHHHHDHHNHTENMWKGLVAMLGLILFFVMEKVIIFGAKWRKKKQLKKKMPKMKVMRSNDLGPQTNGNERQCKHKYSSIPYCYDTITMMDANQDQENAESHNETANTTLNEIDSECEEQSFKKSNSTGSNKLESSDYVNKLNGSYADHNKKELNKRDSTVEEFTVILREHENKHHGHSHTHGHVHAAPQNLSSVVWMVIMGDGLHNFTDGMAIGAAFTGGIAGGFSTAVAVFCHELPHEIGDFAMLLKAGMSMKQALFYNVISSFLCLLGNAVGVWLGEIEMASSWVFAAAAGTFIYIALVDMIPELSSGHDESSTLLQSFLHLSGLLLGCSIMTVIALYEHKLKNMF